MINNIIWTVVTITVPVIIGLLLAIALNGKVRGKPVLRLMFYMPAVLPLVAVASIWGWLYNPQYGAINASLRRSGSTAWPSHGWVRTRPRWPRSWCRRSGCGSGSRCCCT